MLNRSIFRLNLERLTAFIGGSAAVIAFFCAFAAAQAPRVKELNDAVLKDNDSYERLLAEVGRAASTSASLAAANEIVLFRERWWAPGGIAATASGSYQAGSLRRAYELRARIKLLLLDHNGALNDFAAQITKHDPQEGSVTSKDFERIFEHIGTHKTSAERLADINAVIKSAQGVGLLYLQRAKYQEAYSQAAFADIEKALTLSPKEVDIYEFAVDVYFQVGDIEKALAVLEKATNNLPLNFRFHRLRADTLRGDLETGDLRAGVQRLTKVIDTCKCNRVRLYYYLRERAAANLELKNWDAVIADTTQVIEISESVGGKPAGRDDPDDWSWNTLPYTYRSLAFEGKGNYKAALPDHDVLVERSGEAFQYENRAVARCKTGDVAGARKDEAMAVARGATIDTPCGSK